MRAFYPLLLFTLVTNAAPAVVTEIVTEIAQATPEPRVGVQAQAAPQNNHNNHNNNNHNNNSNNSKNTKAEHKESAQKSKPAAAAKEEKYFHEPGWDAESGHYDARYFRGKVAYAQHGPALRRLVRAYLATAAGLGAETWLAHGTLLGWWWNGRVMPWDYDLDVQVSAATLAFLADRYNQSSHEYEYEAEEGEVVVTVLDTAESQIETESKSEAGGEWWWEKHE
ncbi:hypothetical protein ONZ43_g1946 [Nemania bipapillata]|uniref:Uncharacterized protein n=1 Tax=Nemania bipapillata TaxID=110536 RepID=A0ACC2J2G9_9PEZI|nr:hypothetical protein ONZ43_g1946 [Nemania bipapillata]